MIRVETMPEPGDHVYNVRPEEYLFPEETDGEGDDFGDPTEYVWSVESLPPAGTMEQERRRLVPALETLIRQYLEDRRIPASDGVFSYHSIGRCPSTREMWFYLGRPSAFSVELIRRLQRMLGDHFPLWRIVAAYEHLCLLCVYPGGSGSESAGTASSATTVTSRADSPMAIRASLAGWPRSGIMPRRGKIAASHGMTPPPPRGLIARGMPMATPPAEALVPPYEQRLRVDRGWAMDEGDRHFQKDDEVFKTLRKIARRLDELGTPYAIVGGMALNAHGYRRLTVDVDLLVTADSLKMIHEKLEGLGYLPPFAGSKQLRDTENGVRIEFLVAGQFPGDGKPKPVAFPDPAGVAAQIDGIAYLTLPKLVELKLASGMTGGVTRLKDLADVVALIETLGLPAEFAEGLDPYVRPKYLELWEGIRQSPAGPDIA